jgi:hypothetical protein
MCGATHEPKLPPCFMACGGGALPLTLCIMYVCTCVCIMYAEVRIMCVYVCMYICQVFGRASIKLTYVVYYVCMYVCMYYVCRSTYYVCVCMYVCMSGLRPGSHQINLFSLPQQH